MSDCIFCKIVNGEIPAAKVYEDENVLAFLDISQVTKGHTLIIPKVHQENMYELTPSVAEKVFAVVPKVANAIRKQFSPVGLNMLSNTGEAAGQSVFHLHLHLLPRYGHEDDFGLKWSTNIDKYTQQEMQEMAQGIANNIEN
ncbi:HIT family protein [Bacillus solimangrovi]|uniref:Protein hit n=1 Tax=Bacillus solimangrovi TaxID=1305675 RepID=A0A1E5LCC8_9BACI|nr:HIT family protein [Bacillus solimangrovi]OEH91721.1 protein hit [Bacillus solimangrovi]